LYGVRFIYGSKLLHFMYNSHYKLQKVIHVPLVVSRSGRRVEMAAAWMEAEWWRTRAGGKSSGCQANRGRACLETWHPRLDYPQSTAGSAVNGAVEA